MPELATWLPNLSRRGKPRYLGIADAIAADIRSGRLGAGDRLPPQRALAEALGLNFTTVARAYVEAQRRGLIDSRVGQGSFIRPDAVPAGRPKPPRRSAPADFSMNLPPEPSDPGLLGRMAESMAEVGADLPALLRYQGFGGLPEDKAVALGWLTRRGIAAPAERLLICPGAHAALLAVLGHLARAGDAICTEDLTYPGARAIASQLGLEVIGLAMDSEGIDPARFARAAQGGRVKALYLNPTLLNPTTMTISTRRRLEIIAVARRFDIPIVEDDAYGFIPREAPPPFARLAPELTFHVSGLAKCLGAGLRLAYLVTPDARNAWPLAAALRTATVMASPLTAAIAARWIETGTADEIVAAIRVESVERQRLAATMLPAGTYETDPQGFHLWMRLPPRWPRQTFAAHMRTVGIGVVVSDAFATGVPPEAVRICLGGTLDRDGIAHGLDVMAHALEQAPSIDSAYL